MSEELPCLGKETPAPGCRLGALYWACVRNDPTQLQAILDSGVSPEEATQVDSNGREEGNGCQWVFTGVGAGYGTDVGLEGVRGPGKPLGESRGSELPLPQTGLLVACYHGFQSVVALLSHCPFLDVNQQDKGGDTALMLAAQAGHTPLVSLLLNYYAGLDLERRDQRGLTALMKAAMRNRCECVVALLMA
ncbi:Photoreceptor ankyrin repeat protein, partial [Saguinus oedipus]